MRAGERIVQALTALPSAPVAASGGTGAAGGAETRVDDRVGGFSSKDPRAAALPTRPPTQHLDAALTGAGSDLDGVKFSAPTLNFAIKELGERGDFERAHALYVWMGTQRVDPKYAPNSYTLVTLFGAAREKHHAKVIVKAWQRALRLKGDALCSEVASAAITALARCENWPAAYQVWRDCGDAGEPRNQWVYTATLTALRDARRWEEAADVFRAMRDEPGGACRPDAKCACLMLEAHNRSRRWREALTLAKRLEDVYEVTFDEVLTHSVIAIAGRAGDLAFAEKTLEDALTTRGRVVTTYTFNCLLGGYAREGDWEGASRTYRRFAKYHLRPDAYTFTHLVSAAERSGRHEEADAVWNDALASRRFIGPPSSVMCGAYVHCLGCQGRWMEAESIVKQMGERWGATRNAAVYNALLGALVRAGRLDRALAQFEAMQVGEDRIIPTEITFMLLIRACADDGMAKRAAELRRLRDALAETGALENDFSKYELKNDAAGGSGGGSGRGEEDVGRLGAELPPASGTW